MAKPDASWPAIYSAVPSLQRDVPLNKQVFWRVGGFADGFVEVKTQIELATLKKAAFEHGAATFCLGNGSNILVSDRGVRGIVYRLAGEFHGLDVYGDRLTVGAGLKLTVLLNRLRKIPWSGLACMAGIPGTVGGAVRMNAGSSLGETSDTLIEVEAIDGSGTSHTLSKEELHLSYRHSALPENATIVSATFRRGATSTEEERQQIDEFIARRKATQPLDLPSCGSTFTNPPGNYAGALIEKSGLKGHRIGAAEISPKHANFFVNTAGTDGRADDIRALMDFAQKRVFHDHGINLTPEVHFVGDWSHWEGG